MNSFAHLRAAFMFRCSAYSTPMSNIRSAL
uniref:Uncharacterized protein n=1 Tax=Arundo donax TaxID=35708 RepID=A0A0A9GGE3_ARUDO